MHLTLFSTWQVAVVQALLRTPGMDMRRKTNDGKTPLDYAR